jgi:antitoxin ParD1/3/4
MSKNTSVTLGSHFERIIAESIQSGRYASASEVIRAGLRLVDEEEQNIRLLRDAITAGENSGYVNDYDPVSHLESLNAKFKR